MISNWVQRAGLIVGVVVPQLLASAMCHHTWMALVPIIVLLWWTFGIRCRDKLFGNGRRYHFIRQIIFVAATFSAILLAAFP